MSQEAETNEQMLINYLRKDCENLTNRTIAAEGRTEALQRHIKEIRAKVNSISDCADETDMRQELEELIEMMDVDVKGRIAVSLSPSLLDKAPRPRFTRQ